MSNVAILIHGWNPDFYNSNLPADASENFAWSNHPEFIKLLADKFTLSYYNLPGFCGVEEPNRSFNVEDFTDQFAVWKSHIQSDAKVIIGHSFGGAVALDYKARYKDDHTPVVLLSPAIFRGETAKSRVANIVKRIVPRPIENHLKHLYQLSMSPYYRKGTPFLRSTYDIIARRDLRPLLKEVDPADLLIIYGLKDTDTPWTAVEKEVTENPIPYHLITGGGHRLGITCPVEVFSAIKEFHL